MELISLNNTNKVQVGVSVFFIVVLAVAFGVWWFNTDANANAGGVLSIALVPLVVSITRCLVVSNPQNLKLMYQYDIFGRFSSMIIISLDILCTFISVIPILLVLGPI